MRIFLVIGLLAPFMLVCAQAPQIDPLRQEGYQAKLRGDYDLAIEKYAAILDLNPVDYDATLALARLYALKGDFTEALAYYEAIYERDSSDVEALNGFGTCYMQLGKLSQAIEAQKKAVSFLPDHVPLYLRLAKYYSYDGQLDEAIATYQQANAIDNTYAEVWAGLGRMYYWKSLPATSLQYYKRALELDPENVAIRKESQGVRNELRFRIEGKFQVQQEVEQVWIIDAQIQRYTLSKRWGNHWGISANFLLDHSLRDYYAAGDTTRWFDNTWINLDWISAHHKIRAFGGYTKSDDKFTTYGLSWTFQTTLGKWNITNTALGGYNYFFYWNQAGKSYVEDNLSLTFRKRLEFNGSISTGLIDAAPTKKHASDPEFIVRSNPFLFYGGSLNYTLLQKPKLKIGFGHSFMDFEYQSPNYYSPYRRRLTGPTASFFHNFSRLYIWASGAYNLGSEIFSYREADGTIVEGKTDVDNWSASLEVGYNVNQYSVSIGGSRFQNPFYENWVGFIALAGSF